MSGLQIQLEAWISAKVAVQPDRRISRDVPRMISVKNG